MSADNSIISQAGSPGLTAATIPIRPQVETAVRATGRIFSRAVYTTCYCTSYGVTFPIVFLLHLFPVGVPLAAGIGDGAHAALQYVRATKRSRQRLRRQDLDFDEFESNIDRDVTIRG